VSGSVARNSDHQTTEAKIVCFYDHVLLSYTYADVYMHVHDEALALEVTYEYMAKK
jgi:hypothetical protein